jgi:type VI secretion system protein ImpM
MAGFYGKLPAKGDFLTRGLPREFIDRWDDWLQHGMNDSRQSLGEGWLQTYLTSPLWRYVVPANTLSPDAWAGVFMPSMDKVGRYFPMMIATKLPDDAKPLLVAASCNSWFEAMEGQLLAALDEEQLDMDHFDTTVQGVSMPTPSVVAPVAPTSIDHGTRLPLDANANVAQLFLQQSVSSLEATLGHCCIWWGHGSELVAPSFVMSRGLPGEGRFTAMLDGNWGARGWSESGDVASGITPTVIDVTSL